MSAAIGGIIGCGLLTILVLIIAVIVNFQPLTGSNSSQQTTPGPVPTLDPTSDAARDSLLGQNGE
jgi:hypothetical protein